MIEFRPSTPIPRTAMVLADGARGRAVTLALAGAGFGVGVLGGLGPVGAAPVGVVVTAVPVGPDGNMQPDLHTPQKLMQDLAANLPDGAGGVAVLLLDGPEQPASPITVSDAAFRALVRHMALALAPRVRVNAVAGGEADEVAQAVLAILALPSMTGQVIVLP